MKPAIESCGGTIFATRNSLRNPKIIAHRGYHMVAPENSLPAFRAAAEMGAWAIETDVHRTKDGVLVCCHNPTVDSYCSGTGTISEMTFEELSRLHIVKGRNVALYTEEELRIPTFREYLTVCRTHGAVPFLEFKAEDIVEDALYELRGMALEDYCVLSAISFDVIKTCRAHSDRAFIHWIFGNEEEAPALAALGYAGMSYKIANLDDVPDGLVERTHRLGLRLCFRAADTKEVARRSIEMGLDYFPSNTLVTL
ncbi:MAG: hypothetical protein J6B77_09935 [Clostridia bacterium]|nr:hypothetical protein [Clostridia bacterium]